MPQISNTHIAFPKTIPFKLKDTPPIAPEDKKKKIKKDIQARIKGIYTY